MKKYIFILLLIVGLFSCNHDSTGIFYSISKAEAISSSGNLPDELLSIYSVSATNGAVPNDTLYVSGKQIYKKDFSGTKYTKVALPVGGYTNSSELAIFGTNVYALWATEDGRQQQVFSFDGSNWTAVSGYSTSVEFIRLFESTNGVYVHYIDSSVTPKHILEAVGGAAITLPVDIEVKGFDTDGVDNYVATAKQVYRGAVSLGISLSESEFISAFKLLGSNDILIGTTKGNIYRYNGTWTSAASVGTATAINSFVVDPRDTSKVFIATDDDGLGFAAISSLSSNSTPDGNYLSTDLNGATVVSLFATGSGNSSQVYAGTTKFGLWKLAYNNEKAKFEWTHENSNE